MTEPFHNEPLRIGGRRLGRRAPKRAMRLMLMDYLTGVAPKHPGDVDHFSQVSDWGLYHNDTFGVCGPTSLANYIKMVTKYLNGAEVTVTDEAVFDLYRRSGNPNFDPNDPWDDNGVDMQTMLEAATKGQMIGAPQILAFAAVDHTDFQEMEAAIALFGGLLLGVDLQVAQQDQTDNGLWDYKPSAEWGGHAILNGRYDSTKTGVITWATEVDMTNAFVSHQLQEAWVVITENHMRDKGFLEGVDLKNLATDYQDLTGRPFPVVEPAPTPAPTPGPAPASDPVDMALVQAVGRLPYRRAVGHHEMRMLQKALRAWLEAKNYMPAGSAGLGPEVVELPDA